MDWVKTYDLAPERSELLMVAQSWDTATSRQPNADWSVCSTWGLTRQGCPSSGFLGQQAA